MPNTLHLDNNMKLHHSQTMPRTSCLRLQLDYHMKLHHSQTMGQVTIEAS